MHVAWDKFEAKYSNYFLARHCFYLSWAQCALPHRRARLCIFAVPTDQGDPLAQIVYIAQILQIDQTASPVHIDKTEQWRLDWRFDYNLNNNLSWSLYCNLDKF